MSPIAGIRRTRSSPVILALCPLSTLQPGERVIVEDHEQNTVPYVADTVFGPQQVLGEPAVHVSARILRLATADECQPAIFHAEVAFTPLSDDLPSLLESDPYGARGFGLDLPALGDQITLADGQIATVVGINGRQGRLQLHLANGEPAEEWLPGFVDHRGPSQDHDRDDRTRARHSPKRRRPRGAPANPVQRPVASANTEHPGEEDDHADS